MIKRLLADSSDEMRMRRTLREAGDMIRELVGLIDSIPDNKPLVDLTVGSPAPARPKPAPKAKA